MTLPPLTSARLRLEPLTDAHLPDEVRLDTDPGVMTYVGGPALDARQWRDRTPAAGNWGRGCPGWASGWRTTATGWSVS